MDWDLEVLWLTSSGRILTYHYAPGAGFKTRGSCETLSLQAEGLFMCEQACGVKNSIDNSCSTGSKPVVYAPTLVDSRSTTGACDRRVSPASCHGDASGHTITQGSKHRLLLLLLLLMSCSSYYCRYCSCSLFNSQGANAKQGHFSQYRSTSLHQSMPMHALRGKRIRPRPKLRNVRGLYRGSHRFCMGSESLFGGTLGILPRVMKS